MDIMPNTELAYLAGFIDGEGFIGYVIRRDRQKERIGHINLVLQVKVANTNYPILLWIQKVTGFGTITELRGLTKLISQKPCYEWSCYGDNARGLIALLKPYLRIKASQGFLI